MKYLLFVFTLITLNSFAQQAEIKINNSKAKEIKKGAYNALSPAKAAFYSALVPGLGQAYNKKYWKIPIIYAALGGSIFGYVHNNNKYNQYRTAFKLRKAGEIDEFSTAEGVHLVSTSSLQNSQENFKKGRDLSLILAVGFYALQILEASVNAHLLSFDVNNKLSMDPVLLNPIDFEKPLVGLSLQYNF